MNKGCNNFSIRSQKKAITKRLASRPRLLLPVRYVVREKIKIDTRIKKNGTIDIVKPCSVIKKLGG